MVAYATGIQWYQIKNVEKNVIKIVHDNVHCGITSTQKCLKLKVWWPGYAHDVEYCVHKCLKMQK